MCQLKAHGGKRCRAERYRVGSYIVGDVASRSTGGVFTQKQAQVAITRLKRVEQKRNGLSATGDFATKEELAAVTQQLKGMIMETNKMAGYVKAGHLKRWAEHVSNGSIPRALLNAWRTVLDWARRGFIKRLGVGFLTVGLLTACGGGGGQEPTIPTPDADSTPVATASAEPTETEAPTEAPTDVNGVDLSAVEIPTEVSDLWDEDHVRVGIEKAHDFRVRADSLSNLHEARDESVDETVYYEPLRSYMTADAYDDLIGEVRKGKWNNVVVLVERVDPSGSLDGGETYLAEGDLVVIPSYESVSIGADASDQQNRLTVTTRSSVVYKNNADAPHDYIIHRTQTLALIPDGDGWIIDGWSGEANGEVLAR